MPDFLQSPSLKRREMRAFPAILDKSITKKYKAWFLFIRFGVFKALNIVHKNSFWSYQPFHIPKFLCPFISNIFINRF